MNNKSKIFFRNFSYTFSSNLITMIISTIIILIVPKVIGIEDYGYWQIYLFYSSYVGFLHFGWNDGIYLRYGGKEYSQLEKKVFFSQFWMLFIFQILVASLILAVSLYGNIEGNKFFILIMTVVCMLFVNIRLMLIYILQITNRIKEYAQIIILEKIIYCFLILFFLFLGTTEFQILIFSDLIGKLVALIYAVYCCKNLIINKVTIFVFDVQEVYSNIKVGIKLMFANIASLFIIGVVRFGIERNWDVSTFGKVSLTLSISGLIMTFINAIGIIIFPILKRTDVEKLPSIYKMIRTPLSILLLGLLITYYPLNLFLVKWLPRYAESLIYMSILFPMFVYEGKTALLTNTYFKTIRKEHVMLKINLLTVGLSVVFTILFAIVFDNLTFIILSIVVLLGFRSFLSELILSKILDIRLYKELFAENILIAIFIFISWSFNPLSAFLIYLVLFSLIIVYLQRELIKSFIGLKAVIKK